jgi:hypothetical protein
MSRFNSFEDLNDFEEERYAVLHGINYHPNTKMAFDEYFAAVDKRKKDAEKRQKISKIIRVIGNVIALVVPILLEIAVYIYLVSTQGWETAIYLLLFAFVNVFSYVNCGKVIMEIERRRLSNALDDVNQRYKIASPGGKVAHGGMMFVPAGYKLRKYSDKNSMPVPNLEEMYGETEPWPVTNAYTKGSAVEPKAGPKTETKIGPVCSPATPKIDSKPEVRKEIVFDCVGCTTYKK